MKSFSEHIENEFQRWLKDVNERFAYVLCAPECAARHAFEAGYNTRSKEIKSAPAMPVEPVSSEHNNALDSASSVPPAGTAEMQS